MNDPFWKNVLKITAFWESEGVDRDERLKQIQLLRKETYHEIEKMKARQTLLERIRDQIRFRS